MPQARLFQTKQGTVTAGGVCTITFDPPPIGTIFTGTVTVTDSDNGIIWTLKHGAAVVTTVTASTPLPSVQAVATEQVSLTASNLVAGKVYTATWVGIASDDFATELVGPDQGTLQIITTGAARVAAPLANHNLGPGSVLITVQLLPNERSLVIVGEVFLNPPLNAIAYSVIGNQTGTVYGSGFWNGGVSTNPAALPAFTCPAYGSADTSVNVSFSPNGGFSSVLTVEILAVPDEVALGTQANPEFVVPVALNASGSYTPSGVSGNPYAVELQDGAGNQQGTATHPLGVELFDGAGNQQGTVTHPVIVAEGYNAADSVATAQAATTTVAILAAPAGGTAYRIRHMSLAPRFAAAPALGSFASIQAHSNSNEILLQKIAQTGSLDLDVAVPADFLWGDGLDLSVGCGAGNNVQGTVVYRLENI